MPVSKSSKGISKKRRGGRKANSKNLKKTSATGAYAPSAKKNFRTRRAPFVETKKRETAIVATRNEAAGYPAAAYPFYSVNPMEFADVPNGDAYTSLRLMSYWRMNQGLGDSDIVGDSVYSRYLKAKVDIRWPSQNDTILQQNKVYMIQGWCKTSMMTNEQRGIFGGIGTNQTTTTASDVQTHLGNSLKQYFNEPEDRLRFMPKTQTDIVILRKDLLKPPVGPTSLQPQSGPVFNATTRVENILGAFPDTQRSYTWKINRKIVYSQGTGADGNHGPSNAERDYDIQNMFPNDDWLPFLVLYNPDFATYKDVSSNISAKEQKIKVRFNDCHWFSDS